jgi:serine/threonine protein kinase
LADFGLSRISTEVANSITISEGSIRWSAPELFKSDEVVRTAESDLYAIGCVFLEVRIASSLFRNVKHVDGRLGLHKKATVSWNIEQLRSNESCNVRQETR